MVKMPTDVHEALSKQVPVPIATASAAGIPNVVYIRFLKILDDETLMIGDNFFNKTAKNLEENPKISILCYDTEAKKSFQIKGSVTVHKKGDSFNQMLEWVHGVNKNLPAKSAVVVKIEEIYDAMYGPNAGKRIV
jgi:hypothetical protein